MRDKLRAQPAVMLALGILLAVVLLGLIAPMAALLIKAGDFEPVYRGFAEVLGSATARKALWNSTWISLAASFIAVGFAFFFAYIVEIKLEGRRQKAFRLLAVVPMLVPSITHGITIVYLFGKMGLVTRLIGFQLPIYGPLGIILGSFFYAFPIAFLVLSQGLANLDGRLFENAVILGVSPARRFGGIVLPIMKYAVFSAFAVCFTMIFTDYGIPLSVGGTYPILPILFYKNVVGMLDFGRGAIYSTMILLPAAVVYLLDILVFSKKQVSSRHNRVRVRSGPFHSVQKGVFIAVCAILVTPLVIIAAAPFITAWPYDLTPTVAHFARILRAGRLLRLTGTSVLVALMTGVLGTALAFLAGYVYIRHRGAPRRLKQVTHGLYMVSLAVPGLALGLAYALFFRGTPLYNTLAILVMVNIVHFFGSPYMMVISHFKLLNPNLEAICRSLGGKGRHVLVDVLLPNSRKMLLDVFVYFFTNSMITISAVSMLYTTKSMTLALQITAYSDQGTWESAVAVSLMILVINVGMRMLQNVRLDKKMRGDAPLPPVAAGVGD